MANNTYTKIAQATTDSLIISSIPATYKDLMLCITSRDLTPAGGFGQTMYMQFNGDGSALYSSIWGEINGTAAAYSSNNGTNQTGFRVGVAPSTTATAGVFGSMTIHIPNYASSNLKQYFAEYATENNSTSAYVGIDAGVYRSTSAITGISIGSGFPLSTLCTYTLYGIKNT
jgi:hypothetical protein